MKLVNLSPRGRFVFFGDTHGDLDVSREIIKRYFVQGTRIVGLGDYVDRGSHSRENLDYLLGIREKHPRKLYLLQGNHEDPNVRFMDCSVFWNGLHSNDITLYHQITSRFPFVLTVGDIIALHGGLPDIKRLSDVEKIEYQDYNWWNVLWADFFDPSKNYYPDVNSTRPVLQIDNFNRIMSMLGKSVLIRGHDPYAPITMFNQRCVTLFSTYHGGGPKTVAIADFDKKPEIKSADDLIIEEI